MLIIPYNLNAYLWVGWEAKAYRGKGDGRQCLAPPLFAKAYVKVGATIYFKQLNLFNILQQISKSIRGYFQNFLTQRKGTSLLPNPIQCSNINTNMYRSNNK